MKTIGFVISEKAGERRRAILPQDLKELSFPSQLFLEKGYGLSIGIKDIEYQNIGCNIVSRKKALECDIITDVKLGDANYLDTLSKNKILFGWAHAVQNINFTSKTIENQHTVIAWESITEDGRYIFSRNREVAGEAAIMHAFRYCGKMPYDTKVAILGNGQTAKGALRILHGLGAEVDVYSRKFEKLFRKKMFEYDVLVNCILWDTNRTDRIIYREDLRKMKPGTLIIDVSCDPYLEIETSHPTTIDDPIFIVDDVIHYCVDNTPAMYPITVSKVLSKGIAKYLDELVVKDIDHYSEEINKAICIRQGVVIDDDIIAFRRAHNIIDK